jgi:hypothetical protein
MKRSVFVLSVAFCIGVAMPALEARDYLTPAEADRIREAQEIFPRTREYLAMVTDRIRESGKRLSKTYDPKMPGEKEKKPKKGRAKADASPVEPESPLQFSSLADLAEGISQCARAIMTNIDERFRLKREAPAEIAKATQLLKDYLEQPLPFMQDLEEKAMSDEDERLARAVFRLNEDLQEALEGARQGLTVLNGPSLETNPKAKAKQ